MTTQELLADIAHRNGEMLQMTLADFTEADMLVRPCPGANHTAWQIGHVIVAETYFVQQLRPGTLAPLPESFAGKFNNQDATSDDPAHFPSKAELLATFGQVRAASVALARSLSDAEMAQSASEEIRVYAPTVAHLLGLITGHLTMHVGQMQVIRRKLGKPILF